MLQRDTLEDSLEIENPSSYIHLLPQLNLSFAISRFYLLQYNNSTPQHSFNGARNGNSGSGEPCGDHGKS